MHIINLAQIYVIKSYWILQNARVTTFTVSELLKEINRSGGKNSTHPD